MTTEELNKEHRILISMRKTLARVVRETAPQPGIARTLSEEAVEDIRLCLGLIAAREQEIMQEQGRENNDRPRYVDEPKNSTVISFSRPNKDETGETS